MISRFLSADLKRRPVNVAPTPLAVKAIPLIVLGFRLHHSYQVRSNTATGTGDTLHAEAVCQKRPGTHTCRKTTAVSATSY